MSACLICLGAAPPDLAEGPYHVACLQQLLGVPRLPRVALDLQHLPARIAPEIGKMSISGMQRKALMRLSKDERRLQVANGDNRFILKPQIERYAHVPENEHASMRLAALAGVVVPPLGLFPLEDGSMAYVIQRYDRVGGRKLVQEDFCQLAGRKPQERDLGSAEECAALLARYATRPDVELPRLFRLLLVAFWIGDGDLHMKNLSLLQGEDGAYRLSPAYDLVCTWIYDDTSQTLPMGGRKRDLRRPRWLDFAEQHARMPRAAAAAIMDEIVGLTGEAQELLRRSRLPEGLRLDYERLLRKRRRTLE